MKLNLTSVLAVPSYLMKPPAAVRTVKLEVLNRHRSLPHIERKFYHFVMGMICFSLYAFLIEKPTALLLLTLIGGPLVVFDFLRLKNPEMNEVALRLFGKIMRREELRSFSGNSFFVVGILRPKKSGNPGCKFFKRLFYTMYLKNVAQKTELRGNLSK